MSIYEAPSVAAGRAATDGVYGSVRYLSAQTESSLFRNGKVYTARDKDGSDNIFVGCDYAPREMLIRNARLLPPEKAPTLHANGFALCEQPLIEGVDFLKHHEVVRKYYPTCAEVVRRATGATVVAPFDHNVRSATGSESKKRIAGGQQVQGAAHIVHGDYTLTSAAQRVIDLTNPPKVNDTLRSVLGDKPLLDRAQVERVMKTGRWGIVNVWRNIVDEPVLVNPLAMCDSTTVAKEDLVTFEIHYADRIGENYFAKHRKEHTWWHFPRLQKHEALLLKTWDSAGRLARTNGAESDPAAGSGEPCSFSFHSAFVDPTTPKDAPDRWSCEVRCVVLFDDSCSAKM
eukprot:TRINITY_DN10474_c0_g1_i2.p1 TRINITY_DN10474_c0_g1~~TRINITY_DN10474_c0_g1_i2.p1  ORF type:complete len:344 (+),score=58.38 TRINITY_DN10474_c0_g1_i2:49-1080(+)